MARRIPWKKMKTTLNAYPVNYFLVKTTKQLKMRIKIRIKTSKMQPGRPVRGCPSP